VNERINQHVSLFLGNAAFRKQSLIPPELVDEIFSNIETLLLSNKELLRVRQDLAVNSFSLSLSLSAHLRICLSQELDRQKKLSSLLIEDIGLPFINKVYINISIFYFSWKYISDKSVFYYRLPFQSSLLRNYAIYCSNQPAASATLEYARKEYPAFDAFLKVPSLSVVIDVIDRVTYSHAFRRRNRRAQERDTDRWTHC
jgi:uncharacterized membrane-anchored protein YitT (DUF2179 family)